jgi:hypothetical protein
MDDIKSRVSVIETDLEMIKYNLEKLKSWISAQTRIRERSAKDAKAADHDYFKSTFNV